MRNESGEIINDRKFTTQMDDSNFSSEGLKKKKYTIIGGVDPGHRSENVHMSTNITSLKQLCSMGGTISALEFETTSGVVNIKAICGNNMLPEQNAQANASLAQKNYLFQLAPAFGFYRGSMRLAFEIWRILDYGTTAATHKGIGPCTVKAIYDSKDTDMMFLTVEPVTYDQMETVLGRLGNGSKMVICGDLAQIDLKVKKETGFSFLTRVEEQVKGFKIFALQANHRHDIVSPILKVYQDFRD